MMCLGLFRKKAEKPMVFKPRMCLEYAVNDYPGTQNDLNGCIDDQIDVQAYLKKYFPDYGACQYQWRDSQVSHSSFKDNIVAAIKANPGVPVIFFSDSCFSGTNTRGLSNSKPRFIKTHETEGLIRRRQFMKSVIENKTGNWIAISGCGEHQTSADAYINGRYNGAATYAALHSPTNCTWREWVEFSNKFLEKNGFDQRMTIEGNPILLDKLIFSHDGIFIHYSGHGTQVRDVHGDEPDKYDEALYFPDGPFVDDEINEIFSLIK